MICFWLLLNKLKEEHFEQLFCNRYFSNVQMTFSLLVAGQIDWIEHRVYKAIVFQMLFPKVKMLFSLLVAGQIKQECTHHAISLQMLFS